MTKGQRAMAVAMLYPDGQQGKKTSFATNEVAGSSIRKARLVLRVLPEQAKGQRAMAVAMVYPEAAKLKRKDGSFATKDLSSGSLAKARLVLRVLPEQAKGQRAMAVAMVYPEAAKLKRKDGSFATKDLSSGSLAKARLVLRVLPEQAKGQRAMAVAMLYPEPKRGMHSEFRGETQNGPSKGMLSKARLVLRVLPEQAKSVLAGDAVRRIATNSARNTPAGVRRGTRVEVRSNPDQTKGCTMRLPKTEAELRRFILALDDTKLDELERLLAERRAKGQSRGIAARCRR